jgi:predicted aspartyl protease
MRTKVDRQHSKSKSELSNDHEVRIFEIPGQLAKHTVKALGDYGAKRNFVKEEYAIRLGLPINRSVVRKVTVGSGKEVTTVGTATGPFRFKGEHGVHNLNFHLLPDCIHDVILGKSFLKLTETFSILSNFYRRVQERVVKGISQFHLLYLGASSPMFEGSINGQPRTALADSGAKVLVMDEAYARSIGVPIHHEDRTTLKFADNSIADTSGMAYNVEWRFGRNGEFTTPYRLNFHILKNAPANIILCDTFLFDNEAFSRYHDYLIDNDDDYEYEDDESHCFAIDFHRRKKRMQSKMFTIPQSPDSLPNCRFPATATACSLANLEYLELVRRGEEEDRIADLPADEQTAAQNIENRRCAEWDQAVAAVQANSQPQSLQLPFATSVSQLQSTKSAHSSPTNRQGSGSSRTLLSRFLKWPTWPRRGQLTTSSR